MHLGCVTFRSAQTEDSQWHPSQAGGSELSLCGPLCRARDLLSPRLRPHRGSVPTQGQIGLRGLEQGGGCAPMAMLGDEAKLLANSAPFRQPQAETPRRFCLFVCPDLEVAASSDPACLRRP